MNFYTVPYMFVSNSAQKCTVQEVSKASFALGQKTFVHPRWSKDEAVMFPPELIKLMQRCWHHVSTSVLTAAFPLMILH